MKNEMILAVLALMGSALGQAEYSQCGGIGWGGSTTCASPWVCTVINPYYSQCLPGSATTTTHTTTPGGSSPPPTTGSPTTTGGPSTTAPTGISTATPLKNYFGSRWYGSAIAQSYLNSDAKFKSVASFNINAATAENDCKFDATEPNQNQFSYGGCDAVQTFIAGLGGKFRGHNLVWSQQLPGWVNSLSGSAVQSAMTNHITTVMKHYAGKAYCWDVVNEPFNSDGSYASSPWYTAMGTNYLNIAFTAARAADSTAKLYLNDYNIEYSGGKSTAAYNAVKSLKSASVIDGVGFEAHYIVGQTPNSASTAAQFAALGVEIWYTELDIRMPTPGSASSNAQQATDYGNVIKYCIQQPACVAVTTWGITDLYSWVPGTFSGYGSALPWDSTYSAKPAWTAIAQNA